MEPEPDTRLRNGVAPADADPSVRAPSRAAESSGLVINATFDVSITGNPNAAAIQATINQAIATYQSLFADDVTVNILFRYAATAPNGTPLGGLVARSNYVIYHEPWFTYINALKADATSTNDTSANTSLPVSALSSDIIVASANGRAVGLNTAPAMFGNGAVSVGGPYDGIVTLNSTKSFQFSRPAVSGKYDALRAIEHEVDEILGFGSALDAGSSDLRPQDLFSWSAPGFRNVTSLGARYFSIDSGSTSIVDFNQDSDADLGDWLSGTCPNAVPHVQDAFECTGQIANLTDTSPEGIDLDVIGYDLKTAAPTPTPTVTPIPTPKPTPTLTPTPTPATPTPTPIPVTPTLSLGVTSKVVPEGADATFTISALPANPAAPTLVRYIITGKAQLGVDYNLSGTFGQAIIPAGASSATVILHTLTDVGKERNEKVTMKLAKSPTYKLSRAKKATVIIVNVPSP
jgi:hypothetical protein